jgi:endoglucanase
VPRLSFGLPALAVAGNKIVNAQTGRAVLLRGVNRSGFEYSSPEGVGALTKTGINEAEISQIVDVWGANIIRLPFNQDWALERQGYDPAPYRADLEAVIAMAARRGAYTLLDLQWLDSVTPRGTTGGKPNFVAPLPNPDSIRLWQQLAASWRDEPAVLYDIFNEPHDALPDDTVPLMGIAEDGSTFPLRTGTVTMNEWQPWARHLIGAIRSENPSAVVFVPGTNWAFDLTGHPIPGVSGAVYSTHVYVPKGSDWARAFGDLASAVPVFAGEWGGGDDDTQWGLELAAYFDQHELGWTAWSWADWPWLVDHPPTPPYNPTRFGSLVRDALAASADSLRVG